MDLINNKKNLSDNINTRTSFDISKSKEKKYDIRISNSFSYNYQKTTQTNASNSFRTYALNIDGTVYYRKNWSLITGYELNVRQKTEQVPGITNGMWNAKLQRTFKKDAFTAYLNIHDILNQNIGIDRSFYSNTFTETRNDRLKRYWMLGFAWNFKNKATKQP